MRILSRYLLASYLRLFVSILFASMLVIAVIEMMLNFDRILDRYEGIGGVATYMFLRLPSYYLRDLFPITSFAAAFFCLGIPARWREITAMKAGGISVHRSVLPVLLAAAGLAVAGFALNETVVLGATRTWERGDQDRLPSFRRGSFWYHRGSFVYNVRDADRDTKTLRGVSVFELGANGRLRRSIHSELARIDEEHRWHFADAVVRSFDPSRPAAPPQVERVQDATLEVANERDLALLDADPSTLSIRDLLEYIDARREEGADVTAQRGRLHWRLADPWSVLLFALLAVPLGLSVERSRSMAVSALFGVALVAGFYTLKTTASLFAEGGYAVAVASPWILLALFAAFGTWRLARVPS